jgi:imidazole glycerol-phosphate synthase subunit HisH
VTVAILDYRAGNLTSVARAITHLGYRCSVTHRIEETLRADRIIIPGVGAAGSAMESLKQRGLEGILGEAFLSGKPILGVCLGAQIILEHSDENDTPCLGLLNGRVRAFPLEMKSEKGGRLKIPHMGWNHLRIAGPHPLLAGIGPEDAFYFVHSFYPEPASADHVLATTEYGVTFPSVIGFRNLVATQFHLEKSGRPGLAMLKNFCEWKPC